MHSRTSKDTWLYVQEASDNIPWLDRVSKQPTDISFEFDLTDTGRYDMYTSIKAEIRDCGAVLLQETSKKLFGTATHLWLAQADLSINETAGPILPIRLSAMVDTATIHSCDFITSWAGDMTISTDTDIKHSGQTSIKCTKASPDASTQYDTTFNPEWTIALDGKSEIRLWCYPTTIDYDWIRIYLHTDNSNYSYKAFPTMTAEKWNYCTFDLTGFTDVGDGVTLSNIDYIVIAVDTDASPPDTLTIYLDDIRAF